MTYLNRWLIGGQLTVKQTEDYRLKTAVKQRINPTETGGEQTGSVACKTEGKQKEESRMTET
jgi:hypothetical protein